MNPKAYEKQKTKPPTARQLKALRSAGITETPTTKREAQARLAVLFRPRSRRGERGRRATAVGRPRL